MRRASLTVAFLATMTAPAFAQTQPVPSEGVPLSGFDAVAERDGGGESPMVVLTAPAPVQQKTRSLVARSSQPARIDFRIPWQTGIYQ